MAKMYADLIIKGRAGDPRAINPKTGTFYTIEDVPFKLREAVLKILGEE